MKYLELEIFNNFECTASECPFTCCSGGWKIVIDPDTYAFYQTIDSKISDKLHRCIRTENNIHSFVLTEDGRCPFLNQKGLCEIYLNLGEEHLSNTCTYYPRYIFTVGDIQFAGVSISCPEVAKYFLTHTEPMQIDFAENETVINNESDVDWVLFNQAIRAFTSFVDIAQNRSISINHRISLICIMGYQFQTYIDNGMDISGILDLISSPDNYMNLIESINGIADDFQVKLDFCSKIMTFCSGIIDLNTHIPEINELIEHFSKPEYATITPEQWNDAALLYNNDRDMIWQEQVIVYAIFRYFMQGFNTHNFYDNIVIGIELIFLFSRTTLILYHICHGKAASFGERLLLISHVSRMVEHSGNFREMFLTHLKDNKMTDLDYILRLIK